MRSSYHVFIVELRCRVASFFAVCARVGSMRCVCSRRWATAVVDCGVDSSLRVSDICTDLGHLHEARERELFHDGLELLLGVRCVDNEAEIF